MMPALRSKGYASRRGQTSGTDAWILVGLIGLLMVFYIMFMPPAEREALLGGGPSTIGGGGGGAPIGPILTRNPGRLEAAGPTALDHIIPTFKVVELRNAQVLASFNPFSVSNNWLGENIFKTVFHLDNPDLIDAPIFVFEAPSRKGALQVKLNDRVIYNFEPRSSDVPPIMIRKADLLVDNTLEVSVSGVGWRFWSSNRYDLVNPRLIGDVSDRTHQKAQNVFTIAPSEKASLLVATLSFIPNCDQSRVGALDVSLNGNPVYSGLPNCNSPFQTELGLSALHEGVNELIFSTGKGSVLIERAKVSTRMKQSPTFVDYFELNQSIFNDVVAGRRRVEVQVDFVDDGQSKRATLNVNGHLTFIDQRQPFYSRAINPWVLPGPRNYLEIRPETTLNIPELRIVVR